MLLKKKIPIHTQIIIALIFGAIFGVIFSVDAHKLKITTKSAKGEEKTDRDNFCSSVKFSCYSACDSIFNCGSSEFGRYKKGW
jgi:hypothetical protein